MNKTIIKLTNLNKTYKTKHIVTQALNNISLDIREGDFVVITGPSGCGKSTLLSILGLLDNSDDGEYLLANVQVNSLSAAQKAQVRNKHIGFIFQSFNLIEELTAIENVMLPLKFMGVPKSSSLLQAQDVLKLVGLENRANHFPPQLSGGQQQRVAVARALVTKPEIILADEPTGNLDSESGKNVMNLLETLHKSGQTILMVTHDLNLAKLASNQIKLKDGQIDSLS